MMKHYVVGVICAGMLAATVAVPSAVQAQAPDRAALLAQIEQLMKVLVMLQAQLDATRGEIRDLITDANLEEGAESDDVRKVQELLASDPTLFSGQPTGYFGPMTREAIRRFQERYGLEQTGRLDELTREAMNELRKERANGVVPPGLLQSEAAKQRVRDRLQEKWGDCDFTRPLRAQVCERVKDKKDDAEDDDDSYKRDRDRDKDGDVDGDDIDAAQREIRQAQAKLKVLERILEKREYSSRVSQMMVRKAQARLRDAQAKLRAAEARLETDPEAAEELAEDAEELIEDGADAVGEEDTLDEVEETEDAADEEDESEDDETDEDESEEEDEESTS